MSSGGEDADPEVISNRDVESPEGGVPPEVQQAPTAAEPGEPTGPRTPTPTASGSSPDLPPEVHSEPLLPSGSAESAAMEDTVIANMPMEPSKQEEKEHVSQNNVPPTTEKAILAATLAEQEKFQGDG